MTQLPWLDPADKTQPFPHPNTALEEPNGLLAAGGCLSPERLLIAYSQGIFPWFEADTPILWWSPDPRTVLYPDQLRLSRSLRKRLRGQRFTLTLDAAFDAVIDSCSAPREYAPGTWITPQMNRAYRRLHRLGFAHSVESWCDGELVGGLYGVALGRVFFGESMFSRASDASKVALACLCAHLRRWDFAFIDCQLPTQHLHRLGAIEITRRDFLQRLRACGQSAGVPVGPWHSEPGWLSVLLG